MNRYLPWRHFFSCMAALGLALATGCASLADLRAPEPIRRCIEPSLGGAYLLYRPAAYNRAQRWPLIVACQGAFFDSPAREIRAWAPLAEAHGFIVIAPKLDSGQFALSRNTSKQIALQRRDERRILATVQHVRAAHSISDDRIFIAGWSTGASAALRAGLRHPEVFRAISLAQPKVDQDSLADVGELVDHAQPVFVYFGLDDAIKGKHATQCVDWLQQQGVDVRVRRGGSPRRAGRETDITFFENVIQKVPWAVIRAFTAGTEDPLEWQFKLHSSFPPPQFRWQFGDGEESTVAEPVHVYGKPGRYQVTVTLTADKKRAVTRTQFVRVP